MQYFFLQNSFFPTMPQDEVSEIKEALLAARQQTGENPVFYSKSDVLKIRREREKSV